MIILDAFRSEVLASEIERLWADPEARHQHAESGRSRWMEEFTWSEIAGRYESVYRRAASARRGAGVGEP